MMHISDSWADVVERVERAAREVGRRPDDVRVVAVSKTHPAEAVVAAFRAGARDFGENRVQELCSKRDRVRELLGEEACEVRWHMIGQLQSRKVRDVPHDLELIHSLDRVSLVRAFSKHVGERPWPVLVQVDLSTDERRGGVPEEELVGFVQDVSQNPTISLKGLMLIPPVRSTREETRGDFARVRRLFDTCRDELSCGQEDFEVLSMGMSGDFEDAIRAGSTLVRVGSAIFGHRSYT